VTTLAFIDTETTGLDPVRHEIWEVGMILRGDDWRREYVWQLPVDLGRADVIAMNIGGIRQRRGQQGTSSFHPGPDAFVDEQPKDAGPPMVLHPDALPWWAEMFSRLTWGVHVIGAVPSFDHERLSRLLRRHHSIAGWHYHLIDVEALAAGYIIGRARGIALTALSDPQAAQAREVGIDVRGIGAWRGALDALGVGTSLPWSSENLSKHVGVDPEQFDRHSALGDARWAEAMFDAVMKLKGET
jgi:hypothetical protein